MSLRQAIPAFVPGPGLGGGKVRPLRRMVNPTTVGYRAGGNVADVIAAIRAAQSVLIDGSVGVGKSTVLPSMIARELDERLVHVVPSEYLAEELANYLNSGVDQVVTLVTDVDAPWPDKGVVLMCASVIQAKMLQSGELELPECIIYHDESHRSDAWTFLLSKQWGTIKGVKKYINATATAGAGGFRRQEAAGSVVVSKVSAESVDSAWRVFANQGFPWEVSAINGNVLIFEDDTDRAGQLMQDYARAGMEVFRLHSRMRIGSFRAAMQSLRGIGLTVLIADSSFRDGFTWNVSTIIDTGSVITTSVINGEPRLLRRDAFQFEMYQAAGRGARVAGQSCHVWQADRAYQPVRMILDETEMEAVALVSRMLNTLPPIEVVDCKMAEGKVPRDLVAALSGGQPLALMTDLQLVELGAVGYVRSPSPVVGDRPEFQRPGLDYVHPGMSATLANKRDFSSVLSQASVSSAGSAPVSAPSTSSVSSVSFDEWFGGADSVVHAEPGKYYFSSDIDMSEVSSVAFPLAAKSVMSVYAPVWMRHSFVSLNVRDRSVAVAALLERFNQLSCEMNAMGMAAQDVKLLATSRSRDAARVWFHEYLESVTRLQSELSLIADILESAVVDFTTLREVPKESLVGKEQDMAAAIVSSFRQLRGEKDNVAVVADAVDTSWYRVAPQLEMPNPMQVTSRTFSQHSTRGGVSRPVKPPACVTWLAGGKLGFSVAKANSKKK